ncbi:MAG TPA: phosphatidylglycerophosphatase A [Rhizomicrobium sp.]|nr:phosphatidylglycerophosphatase A [Rhizomicrobium sp.]
MRASTLIASVFGIGYVRIAPGTVMSAAAMPLAAWIALYGGGAALLAASLAAFAIGVAACGDHVRATGRQDPSECVIDELAGQWLACAVAVFAAPVSLAAFLLAFVLFRLFDIWKPWPVSWADRDIGGGLGVMTDDMIAGLMAGLLVAAARLYVVPF